MPVTSPKQFRFMEGIASGGLKGLGPSPAVAREFLAKTPHAVKSRFAKMGRPKQPRPLARKPHQRYK